MLLAYTSSPGCFSDPEWESLSSVPKGQVLSREERDAEKEGIASIVGNTRMMGML